MSGGYRIRRWGTAIAVVLVLVSAGCMTTPQPTATLTDTSSTPLSGDSDAKIVAYYPGDNGTHVNETVATGASFKTVGSVGESRAGTYFVPVTMNETAAESFAAVMVEEGYAKGTNCEFEGYGNVSGRCLLTVHDGSVLYSAGVAPSLGESFRSGDFVADPAFRLTTQNESSARALQRDLERAGT
jgi:preprotein translocase subunit SecD